MLLDPAMPREHRDCIWVAQQFIKLMAYRREQLRAVGRFQEAINLQYDIERVQNHLRHIDVTDPDATVIVQDPFLQGD